MSTLSSSSTLAEIKAAYLDSASYEEDADRAKAATFITACRMLLLQLPARASRGGSHEVELDVGQLRLQLAAAQQWLALARRSTTPRVIHPDFTNFRD